MGCQEGEVAAHTRVGAAHTTTGIEDRVGGVARVGALLGKHLHRAAVDRGRAAGIDAIGLARTVGFDLVGTAVLREVAAHGECADRIAGRNHAPIDRQGADGAAAAQQAAAVHRDAAGEAAVHDKRAGIDRGRAGISVGAAERQRARADLDQRPPAAAAHTAISDDPAHRRREIVGADGELPAAEAKRTGALDRSHRGAGQRHRGYVQGAAGVDDEARLPSAGMVLYEHRRGRICRDGGIGGGAIAEKVRGAAIQGDHEIAGRAGREEGQVAVVAVDGGRSDDRACRAALGADMQDAVIDDGAAGVGVGADQEQSAGAGLGEAAAAGKSGGKPDAVAVGIEGGAGRAERRQLRGDVGGVAGRPLQAAAIQRDGARAEIARGRKVHEAARHRGATGIAVVAGQDQRARARLGERAGALDIGCEGERIGEVGDDLAAIVDGGRHDRAGETAGAEIERAATTDGGGARRIDHAAVGNGERPGQAVTGLADMRAT